MCNVLITSYTRETGTTLGTERLQGTGTVVRGMGATTWDSGARDRDGGVGARTVAQGTGTAA